MNSSGGAGDTRSGERSPARESSSTARYRNFDTIRLLAATAVVFSHSFLIADGTEDGEPFVRLLGEKNFAGLYGVFVFFVISGFLITRSFVTRRSAASFLVSRCLRIFPALWLCLALVTFVVGPLFTDLPLGTYLADRETYAFAIKNATLLFSRAGPLPGVSFYDEPAGLAVLGTIWTLRPEFLMYLGVLVAGVLGVLRWQVVAVVLAVGVAVHTRSLWAFSDVGYLAMFFAAGSLLFFVHERRRPTRAVLAVCVAGWVVVAALGAPHEGFALFGSVLVIQVATSDRVSLGEGARYGDLSYGVYLYGWPVQQMLRSVWGADITWWALFVLSMPLALLCAYGSWHLVERGAIAQGRRFRRRDGARMVARR